MAEDLKRRQDLITHLLKKLLELQHDAVVPCWQIMKLQNIKDSFAVCSFACCSNLDKSGTSLLCCVEIYDCWTVRGMLVEWEINTPGTKSHL